MYAVITLVVPIPQYSEIQVRVADSLSILPFFLGWAGSLGLILGCLIANLFSPYGLLDVIIGTFSTAGGVFVLQYLGSKATKKNYKSLLFIGLVYSAIETGAVIGYLLYLYGVPYIFGFFSVAVGEIIAMVILGYPLGLELMKRMPELFKVEDVID